ncbi:MAG: DUF4126 domain-containing protein [Armatimonadetes bacterium]|nr:DUF4126 domain-containing protein [Armatimonadota bacterium]
MDTVEQILMGLALASAAGLRAFLPLLALALGARFHLVPLNGHFAWLHSNTAIAVLAVATVAEVMADKIPLVDHALDAIQSVVRPLAGALAVASTQGHVDPVTAGVLGIILGAPLAGGVHVVKGGTRLASSAATVGLANPFLSLGEDGTSLVISLLAIFVPVAACLLVLIMFYFGWRIWSRVRKLRKQPQV